VTQTRERRMYLMWKAERAKYDYRGGEGHRPLMRVAQAFKVSIREVREIIDAQRASNEED
jgi:hypothetical protein